MALLQHKLNLIRTAMGAVPQLFRNHLVPFKQTEGIVIFVLIDKYIHSRDITDISEHHGRNVFIMQNRRNALILQGTLNNMCLKGIVAGD